MTYILCFSTYVFFLFILFSFAIFFFFFFNDTATTEIYTLSLHDALPIYSRLGGTGRRVGGSWPGTPNDFGDHPILADDGPDPRNPRNKKRKVKTRIRK